MEQKLDLRVQKTYIALTKTLFEMMEEMRFEDIRVSELCDRAMIRKSTFYKHFTDKYELLAFVVRQMQKDLDAQIDMEYPNDDIVGYYARHITLAFDFLEQRKALIHSAVQSNSFPLILSIISDQIIHDITKKLKNDEKRGEILPVDPDVMAAFFVGGIMETAGYWLREGRRLDDEKLKKQLKTMIDRFYRTA